MRLTYLIAVLSSFISMPVLAYGPIFTTDAGVASVWDGAVRIVYEDGDCGTNTNAEMATMLQSSVDAFNNVDLSTLVVSLVDEALIDEDGNTITGDIDATNFDDVLAMDNFFGVSPNDESYADAFITADQNPMIFDDTGVITDAIVGSGSAHLTTLGFAYPFVNANTNEIIRSEEVINCGHSSNSDSTTLLATIIHEMGHGLGLGHTQLHQVEAEDSDATNNSVIPLMYPISVSAGSDPTALQFDDEIGLAVLYPEDALDDDYWTLTGTLTDSSGNGIPCANMVLAAATDSTNGLLSYVTGTEATFDDADGDGYFTADECESNCGQFEFKGLDPDTTYVLSVEPVDSSFTGGSSVGRCDPTNSTAPTASFDEQFSVTAVSTETATIACSTSDCSSATIQRTNSGSTGGGGGGTTSSSSSGCQLVMTPAATLMPLGIIAFIVTYLGIVFAVRRQIRN